MSSTYKFEAETERLLELLTHSIYSNKEIFLRELISNASDAIDKARIKSLTDTEYLGTDADFKIRITVNKETGTILLEDNGIGMTKDELIAHLGTIAKSGTKDFIEKLKESKAENNLIGQFGVGFYSVFMVASKVEVTTKSAESSEAHTWISEGKGQFDIIPSDRTSRGTSILITLKEDEKEYADEWKIQELVRKHSQYVAIPVELLKTEEKDGKTETTWEQLNETKAIWNRSKSELTEEDYTTFYKSLSYDYEKPLAHIHTDSEGVLSYRSILFIPSKKNPFANDDPAAEYGPKLYVQNVLILENAKDLLPTWLRFVTGVVVTNDLPLNISREMLQANPNLEKIKKALTKKVLDKLVQVQSENPDAYKEFLAGFSRQFKEGIYYDTEHKEKIAGLLSFGRLLGSDEITLDAYVAKLNEKDSTETSTDSDSKKEQTIYYHLAKSRAEALANPYIDAFREKNIDVLLMVDTIDEWVITRLTEYKGAKLKAITATNLDTLDAEKTEEEKKQLEETEKSFKDVFTLFKNTVGIETLEEVRVSRRLGSNLGALATKEGAMTPQMEKMMRAMGQPVPTQKRILELNPEHAITQMMLNEFKVDPKSEKLKNLMQYSYDQAVLLEWGELVDYKGFVERVNRFVVGKGE
jgi:molecular chaperone HtpG